MWPQINNCYLINSQIYDLQGKVDLQNGQTLETEQLYYDQRMSGFTEKSLNLQI
jgi:hypothetical protein